MSISITVDDVPITVADLKLELKANDQHRLEFKSDAKLDIDENPVVKVYVGGVHKFKGIVRKHTEHSRDFDEYIAYNDALDLRDGLVNDNGEYEFFLVGEEFDDIITNYILPPGEEWGYENYTNIGNTEIDFISFFFTNRAKAIDRLVSELMGKDYIYHPTEKKLYVADLTDSESNFGETRIFQETRFENTEDKIGREVDQVIVIGKSSATMGKFPVNPENENKIKVYQYDDIDSEEEAGYIANTVYNILKDKRQKIELRGLPIAAKDINVGDWIEYIPENPMPVKEIDIGYRKSELVIGEERITIRDIFGRRLREVTGDVDVRSTGNFSYNGGTENAGNDSDAVFTYELESTELVEDFELKIKGKPYKANMFTESDAAHLFEDLMGNLTRVREPNSISNINDIQPGSTETIEIELESPFEDGYENALIYVEFRIWIDFTGVTSVFQPFANEVETTIYYQKGESDEGILGKQKKTISWFYDISKGIMVQDDMVFDGMYMVDGVDSDAEENKKTITIEVQNFEEDLDKDSNWRPIDIRGIGKSPFDVDVHYIPRHKHEVFDLGHGHEDKYEPDDKGFTNSNMELLVNGTSVDTFTMNAGDVETVNITNYLQNGENIFIVKSSKPAGIELYGTVRGVLE